MGNKSFIKNLYRGVSKRLGSWSKNPYKELNISWLKLKYYKHLSSVKLRTHNLFGKTLFFYNVEELLHAFDEIFIGQVYKLQLQDRPYIFDCGANIGMSVIYIKHAYPHAEVVAFEPDEKNFYLLKKNVESFGFHDVTLRNEAVWVENTTLQFSGEGLMSSKIISDSVYNAKPVTAIRLKDLLNREIDFLKIDIEGAEFEVLNDIRDKLHFVKNLFVEYHGSFKQNNEIADLLTMINRSGFNFYIKEADCVYKTPFYRTEENIKLYDIQLNIFCFRLK